MGGILMMFGMVFFWALIIFGVVYLVRGAGGAGFNVGGPRQDNHNRALEVLQERYAKGEIDAAEYEEKKRALAS